MPSGSGEFSVWLIVTHSNSIVNDGPIGKIFVCKQWRGFEFDSGWQRSVKLPFEAIERGKKFYRRHQLRH